MTTRYPVDHYRHQAGGRPRTLQQDAGHFSGVYEGINRYRYRNCASGAAG